MCRKITNESFSWFKHEILCPDLRALNATIFVYSAQNSIIGKEYCSWRSPMSILADLSASSYFLLLERWLLPFSYSQRATVLLVRNYVSEDHKWEFYSRFNHKFMCPDVRALNATIFVHSTPNSIIGKGYGAWRSRMSF